MNKKDKDCKGNSAEKLRSIPAIQNTTKGNWKYFLGQDGYFRVFQVTKGRKPERFGHTFKVNFEEESLTPIM